MNLVVTNTPGKNVPYENVILVSPEDVLSIDKDYNIKKKNSQKSFVEILKVGKNGLIYQLNSNKNIQKGQVGIAKIQRRACRVNVGSEIQLREFTPLETQNLNLIHITFVLSLVVRTSSCTFEESEIVEKINSGLISQLFCTGCIYLVDIAGEACTLTAQTLKIASIDAEDDVLQIVDKGFINKHTEIEIECSGLKGLKLNKNDDKTRANIFGPKWKYSDMGIGGLDSEFSNIFRRAFASRTLPETMVKNLGIQHVRGLLLYGPPGTGKTMIARQIGEMLHGREPKIVNGPEILNKYIGQSEENIRNLFLDAEQDQQQNGENADLHIIIFDEIDAICKQRGTVGGNTGVADTVVNQLLSKMDGVNSLNNILVIGMTNRKDLIDEALLRPGRFEVHIEIGLPDEEGRIQILKIHTKVMREHNFLEKDVDFQLLGELTKNFSGAELTGLIKSATSFAYYGNLDIRDENINLTDVQNVKISMSHFRRALEEVRPSFGIAEEDLQLLIQNGIINFGEGFTHLLQTCRKIVRQVKNSDKTPLQSILLEGKNGSGTTAFAAQLAIESEFPFTRLISPEDFIGLSENAKCNKIARIFDESNRSQMSLIILDNIERLLDYVDIGPRFSNTTLQTLLVLLKKLPPKDHRTGLPRKLLIIGTTSNVHSFDQMELVDSFNVVLHVDLIRTPKEIREVFHKIEAKISEEDLEKIANNFYNPIGIKQLLMIIEMASHQNPNSVITYEEFTKCCKDCGVSLDLVAS